MAAVERSPGIHVGVRPQCGICGSLMQVNERLVALLGDEASTACAHRIGPYVCPDDASSLSHRDGTLLCRKPGCDACAAAPEASTVHSDCLEFVQRRCKLDDHLDHLWAASAWRSPWHQAPNLRLDQIAITPNPSLASDLGIAMMECLPPEVLHQVYDYSSTSLFWRYNRALNAVRRISQSPSDRLVSAPLRDTSFWERGGLPSFDETASELPVIRLTIDSRGLLKIERLPEYPRFRSWRSNSLVFVVLDQARLEGVTAHFRSGFARLQLPEGCPGLHIWDTPTPPNLEMCLLCPGNITDSTRFRTIDLREVSGLTFFFCYDDIYAIHAHTPAAPSAEVTYRRLSPHRQQSVVWMYVPIAENDAITAFGARMSLSELTLGVKPCLLFRMKLAGDVTVGTNTSALTTDLILGDPAPRTLIYNASESQPLRVIGAYAGEDCGEDPAGPFERPHVGNPPFMNACFSLAPLSDVSRLTVFNNPSTGFCAGVLLEYSNGAQRALGQVRVDVDEAEQYVQPTHVCLRRGGYRRQGRGYELRATRVRATGAGDHSHDEEGWACAAMRGELRFWFSHEETKVTPAGDK